MLNLISDAAVFEASSFGFDLDTRWGLIDLLSIFVESINQKKLGYSDMRIGQTAKKKKKESTK